MNRIIFFLYYLKELDLVKLRKFLLYVKHTASVSYSMQIIEAAYSTFRYNISIMDYFYFRFYHLDKVSRLAYAGTGYMYEYQLKMNPRKTRDMLEDKIKFLISYDRFIKRKFASINKLKEDTSIAEIFLQSESGKAIVKNAKGQVGAEVEVLKMYDYNRDTLINYMTSKNFDLIEEFIVQHPDLMALSPSGLNTIRVITQIHNSQVVFIGARLRISINSHVDNMAAGNAAAPIDLQTGIVNGPAVFSDITKEDLFKHPVTGYQIVGFAIPYWHEIKEIAQAAALLHPENKSIGWDVAVTNEGPQLVEGNHNWCKLLWQLPVKKGLKKELDIFLS